MMGMLADVLENRDRILKAAAVHGAHQLRVFGSVARGEAVESSDIDFLVEFESSRSLLDHVALIQELEDMLGRDVDVVNEKALHPVLRERVLSEAILL